MSGFRSGLEDRFSKYLDKQGVPYLFEAEKFAYVTESKYTPDFFLQNGVRFVFQRNNTLSKNSKTTYGDWATKHGFQWCIYPDIPPSWLQI
jgi:hypothetical protein